MRSDKVVLIEGFDGENYEVIRPFSAVVRRAGDSFVATIVEANIAASGEHRDSAVGALKTLMLDTYELLSSHSPKQLGPGPRRQLAVLRTLLRPVIVEGQTVQYWKGARRGEPTGTAIVTTVGDLEAWLEGVSGCIACTHLQPVLDGALGGNFSKPTPVVPIRPDTGTGRVLEDSARWKGVNNMSKKPYSHEECRQVAGPDKSLMAAVVEQLIGDVRKAQGERDEYKTKWETNELHAEQMRGNVQGLRSALAVLKTDLKESKSQRSALRDQSRVLREALERIVTELESDRSAIDSCVYCKVTAADALAATEPTP